VVTTVHHPLTVDRRASFIRDTTFTDTVGTQQFYPVGMQSFVARRLDCILTSSEASAADIVRDFGVQAQRVRNVHNGLDTELYCPDPAVTRNEAELLCVGRAVDPNKGIRTLIGALARLPEHVTLTLVDDDSSGNPVFKWAREAGVGTRLKVTGRVATDELVSLYRRTTLTVVPSRYEGFGLPAVESMACGAPVVACKAGSLPEVMQLAQGGLLVEKDCPEALAKGIANLLEQPELRTRLGTKARDRVVEAFSWPRVAQSTAQVYADVLSERRGRPARTITSDHSGTQLASQSSA
jgi:glycosyltransferase involved in cell wall biosynthesis